MDILSVATQWAKEEIFSAKFFVLAAILFIAVAFGFWKLGQTALAKAYVTPILICGTLLMIVGAGLLYSNYKRLNSFPEEYRQNPTEFVEREIVRSEETAASMNRLYVVLPAIMIVAALLIIFVNNPIVRASGLAVIAMMVVLLLVDSNSQARIAAYNQELVKYKAAH